MQADHVVCTPLDALSVAGMLQCFDLLVRPTLAGCEAVHDSWQETQDNTVFHLPPVVVGERCLSLLLAPARLIEFAYLVSIDIVATAALTTFGLGLSTTRVEFNTAEQVLTYDDLRGDYISIQLDL